MRIQKVNDEFWRRWELPILNNHDKETQMSDKDLLYYNLPDEDRRTEIQRYNVPWPGLDADDRLDENGSVKPFAARVRLDRFAATFANIREHHQFFNMAYWIGGEAFFNNTRPLDERLQGDLPSLPTEFCDTAGCLAGWAVVTAAEGHRLPSDIEDNVMDIAASWLGLTVTEATTMFNLDQWYQEFQERYVAEHDLETEATWLSWGQVAYVAFEPWAGHSGTWWERWKKLFEDLGEVDEEHHCILTTTNRVRAWNAATAIAHTEKLLHEWGAPLPAGVAT